jgi:hypothetical protein
MHAINSCRQSRSEEMDSTPKPPPPPPEDAEDLSPGVCPGPEDAQDVLDRQYEEKATRCVEPVLWGDRDIRDTFLLFEDADVLRHRQARAEKHRAAGTVERR